MSNKNSISSKQDLKYTEKRLRRYELFAEIVALVMLFVFPLFLTAITYGDVTGIKAAFFNTTTTVAVFVLACIWLADVLNLRTRKTKLTLNDMKEKLNLAEMLAVAYLLICCLSTVCSPYLRHGTLIWGLDTRNDGLYTQICYVVVYLIFSRAYKPRMRDAVVFGAAACLVSIYAILQFYGHDILNIGWMFPYKALVDGEWIVMGPRYYGVGFMTTFGNINIVSTFACVSFLFFSAMYIKTKEKIRIFFLATSILSIVLMRLANSQSGIMGSLAGCLFALPFVITDRRSLTRALTVGFCAGFFTFVHNTIYNVFIMEWFSFPKQITMLWSLEFFDFESIWVYATIPFAVMLLLTFVPGRWIKIPEKAVKFIVTGLVVAVLVVGALGVMYVGSRMDSGTIHEAYEALTGNMDYYFGNGRGYPWMRSLELVPSNARTLLIGSGPDSFGYVMKEAYGNEPLKVMGVYFDKAHNEYIQILICSGVLGLITYLGFVSISMYNWGKKAWHEDKPLSCAAGVSALGYLVQAFFNISVPIVGPFLFIMLGIANNPDRDPMETGGERV